MNELVNLVSEKTGLSEEISRLAVETVINYLKGKLPAPVAGQVDVVLGNGDSAQNLGGFAKGLGGLFGKK